MAGVIILFLTGVLIDLDHLVDYCLARGLTLKLRTIYAACADLSLPKLYIFLHSYELLLLFWLAIYAFSLDKLWVAAAIGLTQHVIFDQITNPVNGLGYFLSYRFARNFDMDLIVNKKGLEST